MKIYLVVDQCEDGVNVIAAVTDEEKASKLCAIFREDSPDVYVEEYDTNDYEWLLLGTKPYRVCFYPSGRTWITLATGFRDQTVRIEQDRRGWYSVFVNAESKAEAEMKATDMLQREIEDSAGKCAERRIIKARRVKK